MLFSDSYFTVSHSAMETLKEKGSKFLAFVFPVQSESEIKDCLLRLRKEHPSATHHCYAWRLGADKTAFRANDDGEPSNTAGKPILSQIQSRDLSNVLVVVVRYFGGTLLGAGGLIQAYKLSASMALDKAGRQERFISYEYEVEFPYEAMSAVMRVLKDLDAVMLTIQQEERNKVIFQIKKKQLDQLEERFKNLYTCHLKFKRQM